MCSQITPDEELTEKALHQFTGGEKVRAHKRRAWKPAAAVVAGLLAFAVAFPYMQSPSNSGTPAAGSKASATNMQNTFGLAVYAADKTHSGNTAVLQMQPDISQYGSTGSTLTGYSTGIYKPSLQCEGTNLKTVEYSLETSALDSNEQVFFVRSAEDALPDMSAEQKSKSNPFTIDYQKKNISEQMNTYEIFVSDKLTDAEWKEHDKQIDLQIEQANEELKKMQALTVSEDAYEVQSCVRMAQILSKARIVLKATFKDGSVQTQTYQIVPKEDYKKNLAAAFTYQNELGIELEKRFPLNRDNYKIMESQQNSPEYKKFYEELIQRATAFVNQHPLFNITKIN